MEQITLQNTASLKASSRLICEEALRRGWSISTPYISSPHLFIDREGHEQIHIYSTTPPTVSYANANLTSDKYATSILLQSAGIPQLDMAIISKDDKDYSRALKMIEDYKQIVVKPLDGSHGDGITVDVRTKDDLITAIERGLQFSKSTLVQQQFEGAFRDVRVLCIGGVFVAATERIPAYVVGDGQHTILELIHQENMRPDRGIPYREKLATINVEDAVKYLGEAIGSVPEHGTRVTVLGIANYGAGGETADITDSVPNWMKDQAAQASVILGLDVAGIDYLVSTDIALESTTTGSKQAVIIEVNKSPSFVIHDEPTHGINRNTTSVYLDFISQL